MHERKAEMHLPRFCLEKRTHLENFRRHFIRHIQTVRHMQSENFREIQRSVTQKEYLSDTVTMIPMRLNQSFALDMVCLIRHLHMKIRRWWKKKARIMWNVM